ncbi:hypothetical protein [uncultured Duncaniella sp.]|jgi:hypothetical protein|uniref:hypothetical protein n=1 Tax=uncultured Duncaniella sp. TaxID=2768039 RepID=UPI002674EE84|nr:hypothetical protein [uncultured Duncaniella sp.]
MTDEEKVANCVDAKQIREELLEALHMTAGEFATALGINYQRIYDLGSGRTKKFNPGMVRLITKTFPQVNPHFLYTGNGPVLTSNGGGQQNGLGVAELSEIMSMSKRLLQLMERLDAKDSDLRERENNLIARESAVSEREQAINERELALSKRELSLSHS